jgi:tRNA1(Val) A37 N6-methylase TrmN6
MTIAEAAQAVLKENGRAMNINEIYDEIMQRNLYSFGAKNPKSVLSQAIRSKSTANLKALQPLFKHTSQNTYELI